MGRLFSLLKVPMYQVEWNGIRLEEVAASLNVRTSELAERNFYEAFYRKLASGDFRTSDDWVAQKASASRRLRAIFASIDPLWREQDRVALAVGAGLGILEIPLIEDGYRIHLHDVQNESLRYFEQRSRVPAEKTYIAPSLADVPDMAYDAVYISQVMYAFDDAHYGSVLDHAYRILKPGGTLMIWDPACQWIDLYARVRSRTPPAGVLWGWMRSTRLHIGLAKRAGFQVLRQTVLSAKMEPANDAKQFLGCNLPKNSAVTLELLLTKPVAN